MKRFFALLVTILTGVSSVCANLGDSADKIEDSYDKVVERHLLDDGTVSVLYHKDRYLYLVIFENLRSICEMYSRIDGRELSPKEISKFLKANAARAAWTPIEQHGARSMEHGPGEDKSRDRSKERRFERSDHKAEATSLNRDGRPTLKVRFKKS
jgi:hypothetical protein